MKHKTKKEKILERGGGYKRSTKRRMEVYRTQSAHNRISQDYVTRTDYVTVIYGYLLLLCTFVFFCVNMYTMVLSKLMPETGLRVVIPTK
jgi:hypothetical protein